MARDFDSSILTLEAHLEPSGGLLASAASRLRLRLRLGLRYAPCCTRILRLVLFVLQVL